MVTLSVCRSATALEWIVDLVAARKLLRFLVDPRFIVERTVNAVSNGSPSGPFGGGNQCTRLVVLCSALEVNKESREEPLALDRHRRYLGFKGELIRESPVAAPPFVYGRGSSQVWPNCGLCRCLVELAEGFQDGTHDHCTVCRGRGR